MRLATSLVVTTALLASCGSPHKGATADEQLEELSAAQGFGFRIPAFDVAAGTEEQDCYFVQVPGTGVDPVWIDRIKAGVNPGSHHFNVFRVKTIVNLDGAPGDVVKNGECFKSGNWADWPLVVNTQNSDPGNPYYELDAPAGVAYKFLPGEKLMLQTHYVNATTQTTPTRAKVDINFYKSADAAPIEMGTLFATQQSIRVCQSNPTPTYFGSCSFGATAGVHIAAANAHFHSRGKQFDIFTWDGTSTTTPPVADRFYQSTRWDDPPMVTGLDVRPPANGGVWWTCSYQWQPPADGCAALNAADPQQANDCCYTFGPRVEKNEHCNIFVYYWPAQGAGSLFCN